MHKYCYLLCLAQSHTNKVPKAYQSPVILTDDHANVCFTECSLTVRIIIYYLYDNCNKNNDNNSHYNKWQFIISKVALKIDNLANSSIFSLLLVAHLQAINVYFKAVVPIQVPGFCKDTN